MIRVASIAALLLLLPVATPGADSLRIYRCTAVDGSVRLQDRPCAAGETTQTREVARPADAPATTPAPADPIPHAPEPPASAPAIRITVVHPQPLWECRRPDGSVYESASGVPQRHWISQVLAPPEIGTWTPRPIGSPRRTPPAPPPQPVPARPGPVLPGIVTGYWVEEHCWQLSLAETCARRRARDEALGRRWRLAFPSERERIRREQAALREQLRHECG